MQLLEKQHVPENAQRTVPEFLELVRRNRNRALLLDYDGTLAPFTPDRHSATPYAEIPQLLQRIRDHSSTRLVIVTGRRAHEVASLLGVKKIEIWGCHGLSRLRVDGTYDLPNLEDAVLARIAGANERLRKAGLIDLLEFKPASTAIHWRGREDAANEIARKVEKVWSKLHSRHGIELVKFDGGMEMRIAGRNKGDAVRTILAETGGTAAIAYLGDDQTDEDAFEALNGHGLSVLVHKEYRPTRADAWIQPPEGVIAFLADWANACGGGA